MNFPIQQAQISKSGEEVRQLEVSKNTFRYRPPVIDRPTHNSTFRSDAPRTPNAGASCAVASGTPPCSAAPQHSTSPAFITAAKAPGELKTLPCWKCYKCITGEVNRK